MAKTILKSVGKRKKSRVWEGMLSLYKSSRFMFSE